MAVVQIVFLLCTHCGVLQGCYVIIVAFYLW